MSYNRSSVIGRGLAFPIRLSDQNRLTMVTDDANIQRSIRLIIFTVPGERVMRPDFGCEIHSLIFAPSNDQTAALAERYVREALTRWEPRIELMDVTIKFGNDSLGEMYVHVEYRIKDELDLRSLVYPFYLLPGEK